VQALAPNWYTVLAWSVGLSGQFLDILGLCSARLGGILFAFVAGVLNKDWGLCGSPLHFCMLRCSCQICTYG
jgi:hypothetical protein